MITHSMPLDDHEAAVETFRGGAGLKIQVVPAPDNQTR
jgi:hypothetical protein